MSSSSSGSSSNRLPEVSSFQDCSQVYFLLACCLFNLLCTASLRGSLGKLRELLINAVWLRLNLWFCCTSMTVPFEDIFLVDNLELNMVANEFVQAKSTSV